MQNSSSIVTGEPDPHLTKSMIGTFPVGFRTSTHSVTLVIFGLIGFAFIDNAAHLGGLVGGLVLGYVLVRPYNQRANAQKIEQQVAILGRVALVILGLVASLAIFKMLR